MRSRNRVQRLSKRRVKGSKKNNRKKSIKKLRRSKRNKRKGGANHNDSEIQEKVEEQINKIVSAFKKFKPPEPGEEGEKKYMTFTSLFDLVFGENNYKFPNGLDEISEFVIVSITPDYDSNDLFTCNADNQECLVELILSLPESVKKKQKAKGLNNIVIKFENGSPVNISKKESVYGSPIIVEKKKKVSGGGNANIDDIAYANEKLNSLFSKGIKNTKTKTITSLQQWYGETPPILVKSNENNENKFFINPVYLNAADNDLQNKLKNLLIISKNLGLNPIIPEKYKPLI